MLTTMKTRRWKREASIRKNGKIIGYVIAAKKEKKIKVDKAKIEDIEIKGLPKKPCYRQTDSGNLELILDVKQYEYCVINEGEFEVELDAI